MSVQNLATVFGPNILRPKLEDPVAIMEGKRTRDSGDPEFVPIWSRQFGLVGRVLGYQLEDWGFKYRLLYCHCKVPKQDL